MAHSSKERSGSEEEIPQLTRVAERAKLAERKTSKPPKVPKKKSESESEEEEDIPSAHSQPEDEQITDSKTLFSDGNPKKGGRGRERNTAAEMSIPETYKTPPGVETTTERNNRLQKIRSHWAKKWFNYENVRRKYQILFAFTPPWNDCIAEGCLGQDDEKVRPAPPPNAHAKREKAKAKHEARATEKNQVEQRNVDLTQQDVQEKKERVSARKEKKKRKYVSPRASRNKSIARKIKEGNICHIW